MEHLILPEGIEPYIVVPYKCLQPYEVGDFMGYPERNGWTKEQLNGDDDYGGRSAAEVEAFFQTWLYFGLVLEVLTAVGVPASQEDFIDRNGPEPIVTTKKLNSLISPWKKAWKVSAECDCSRYIELDKPSTYTNIPKPPCQTEHCWQNLVSISEVVAIHTVSQILDYAGGVFERCCSLKQTQAWPVGAEIALSISALGFTLAEAVEHIYQVNPEAHSWSISVLLKDRLLEAKICPFYVSQITRDFSIDGVYYLAAKQRIDKGDHSKCHENGCVAKGIDERLYRTRHVSDGCDCEHASPPEAEVYQIIERGGTPLMVWEKTGDSGYHLAVREFQNEVQPLPNLKFDASGKPILPQISPKYVAISHVWADGMGNPTRNSLPTCQLHRLQKMVDETGFRYREMCDQVPFWMDTLCVPVGDAQKKLRKQCIYNMRNTYQQAAAVLVLDAGLLDTPLSAPVHERCMRLYQSPWLRRLWTFQESFLTEDLNYRYSDGSQHFRTFSDEVIEYRKDLLDKGYTALKFLRDAESKAAIGNVLLQQVTYRLKAGFEPPGGWHIAFLPLAGALCARTTSRASDEVVCAATILGMDPTPFLNIGKRAKSEPKGIWSMFSRVAALFSGTHAQTHEQVALADQELADRRMELFLQYVGMFEPSVIFTRLPRLQREGYRWAPRTFMGRRVEDLLTEGSWGANRTAYNNGHLGKVGDIVGLCVKLPGIKIIGPVASISGGTSEMVLTAGTARYDIQFTPDEDGWRPVWDEKLEYFLVLARMPDALNGHWSQAILGSRMRREGLEVRFECRARVDASTVVESRNDDLVVACEILPEETFWLIQ